MNRILILYFFFSFQYTACNAHKSVTYPGIGTFTDEDFYDPKWRPYVALPESPEKVDPNYVLYNRKIQYDPQTLHFNNTEILRLSHFDPKLDTKILVHGFMDGPLVNCWMYPMKDKLLSIHDVNVILVDWSKTNFFPYTQVLLILLMNFFFFPIFILFIYVSTIGNGKLTYSWCNDRNTHTESYK